MKYRPSSQKISDNLSKHQHARHANADSLSEDYVKFIAKYALPDSLQLSHVIEASTSDCVIRCVKKAQTNDWKKQNCSSDDNFRCYEQMQDELAIVEYENGFIVLRGT